MMADDDFDLDALVNRIRDAARSDNARADVKALLKEAVKDPARVRAGMPDFEKDDVVLFEDDTVSVWFCRFPPGISVPAHDHQMTATIAVYCGAERNSFYENDPAGGIRKSSDVELSAGNVLQIGPSAIHSVSCASEDACCGIHVYLGKLTTVERSLFDTASGDVMAFSDENYNRLVSTDQKH